MNRCHVGPTLTKRFSSSAQEVPRISPSLLILMVRISMVILSYYQLILKYLGNLRDDIGFEYGEGALASYGCGATIRGQFWYFGGHGESKRQV